MFAPPAECGQPFLRDMSIALDRWERLPARMDRAMQRGGD